MGSNLGNRLKNMTKAVQQLQANPQIRIGKISSLYETLPVGGPIQGKFLNGAIKIKTSYTPVLLLNKLKKIELELGRRRIIKWGPRRIDLDLILFGQTILRTRHLTLPHPLYHKRLFVLRPLCELAPHIVHPKIKMKNRTLLDQLTEEGQRATIFATWKNKQFTRFKKRKPTKSR